MIISINQKLQDARDEEGFTLIELMIVVVIIGILAAIAIPIFGNQQKNAHKAGVKSDVRNTNTALATALTKNPTATGFVTYKTGDAVPTLTAGQIAVQTTNTNDNAIAITDPVSSGSAPDTATGNGAWNGYQILGKSPAVDGYCYYFTSTTGKYSESDNCSTVSSAPSASATSSPIPTPTSSTPAGVVVYSATFDSSTESWGAFNNGTTLATSSTQVHSGAQSLHLTPKTVINGSYVGTSFRTPQAMVVGKSYNLTLWVYNAGPDTITLDQSPDGTLETTTVKGAWTKISTNFTATSTYGHQMVVRTPSTATADFYLDDVTLTQTS